MYKGENGREYIGPVHYREDGFPKTSRPEAVYGHSLLIRREIWPMLKRKHFFRRCSLTMTMLNDSDGNNDNVNDDQWASSSRVMTWLKSASDHQLCERLPQSFGGFITAGYSFIDEARLYSPIFLALQSEMPCRANIGKICRAKRGKFYFNPLESRRQIQERN